MTAFAQNRSWWRGLLLVFLVYFFFLLFSQHTFLHLLEERVAERDRLEPILAAMALSGIIGSFLAVRLRFSLREGFWFVPLILACAGVALAAAFARSVLAFSLLAVVMGLAMGILTVAVAAMLPAFAPSGPRGLMAGLGTGLAYAACNLPPVFSASPTTRSVFTALVLLGGAILLLAWSSPGGSATDAESDPSTYSSRWTPSVVISMVAAFLVLIWLDSAVFYVIQQTRELKENSWEGGIQLYLNAAVHFGGAALAGWLLDKGRGLPLLVAAWLGLAVGALGLQATGRSGFVLSYVAAVSLYSTALVFVPSLHAAWPADTGSFRRSAWLYALAGWIGSALGIGMATDLSGIPYAFVLISAAAIFPVIRLSRVLN